MPEEMVADSLWVAEEHGDLKIPYTLTASAVRYYIDLMKRYEKKDETLDSIPKNAKLTYKADMHGPSTFIINGELYENVKVVTLELSWSTYTNALNAGGFSIVKFVIFDREKNILGVFGDGFPGEWAS